VFGYGLLLVGRLSLYREIANCEFQHTLVMSVEFRIPYKRVSIVACVTMLLVDRPSVSIVALLRKRNNVVLSHCYATGRRRHAATEI
jgi:hypothetical protein